MVDPDYDELWDRLDLDHPLYFDRDANPITLRQWATYREDPDYFRVAETEVGDYWISTVWVGLDMAAWWPRPPRLIYETMVFGPTESGEYGQRYATEQEAMRGHLETVTLVAATT